MYVGSGGDSSSVASKLASGVVSISSGPSAFAAIKGDGSVVIWGGEGTRCCVLFLCVVICGCCCSRVRSCCDRLVGFCVAVGLVLLCVAVCVLRVPLVAIRVICGASGCSSKLLYLFICCVCM